MNCFPVIIIGPLRILRLHALFLLLVASCTWHSTASSADSASRYRIDYRISLDPEAGGARVEMRLRQRGHFLRELNMRTLGGRLSQFEADGELSVEGDRVSWLPPIEGGTLRWFAALSHRRNGDGYDAYIEESWALFRFDDVIPSADTRTLRGTESDTRVTFALPDGWSVVASYKEEDGVWPVVNPERRFDTPTGWIVAGRLGVRIETIDGVRVIVAGPVEHEVRRMDIIALMHWTLPDMLRILPRFPHRLFIVSAGEPMWRGALSAPQSLYVHADRPLLSGNATSTLLHEIVHIGLGLADERGADWIVEGLAEYYSLEVLRRSGTISEERYRNAHRELAAWGREAKELCARHSTGSTTALAVTIMAELDSELRKTSGGRASLEDVLQALGRHPGKISVGEFRDIAATIAGTTLKSLRPARLRGCNGD